MNLLVAMRYMVALDEHQHFARAAQAVFVTQPALSNAIRALEDAYGVVLVKRARQFAGFTHEGELLLASARRLLREQAWLDQAFLSTAAQPVGSLVLGTVPTAEPIAARFAACLQARHPLLRPVVRTLSSPDIEAGLEHFSLDLGLGFLDRPRSPAWLTLKQYDEQYFWVSQAANAPVAADAPTNTAAANNTDNNADSADSASTALAPCDSPSQLAAMPMGAPMTWAQAAQTRLCLMTPEMHNRRIVDTALAQAGTPVTPAMESSSLLTLALSLMDGTLSSIMPGAWVQAFGAQLALQARPLHAPALRTPVGFLALPTERVPRVLDAALAFAQSPEWLAQLARLTTR